jgi:hypothetical protein
LTVHPLGEATFSKEGLFQLLQLPPQQEAGLID